MYVLHHFYSRGSANVHPLICLGGFCQVVPFFMGGLMSVLQVLPFYLDLVCLLTASRRNQSFRESKAGKIIILDLISAQCAILN